MVGRFAVKELIFLVLGLVTPGPGFVGVVAWVNQSSNPKANADGWELTVKSLIQTHLEVALDAHEIDKPKTTAALNEIVRRLTSAMETPLPYRPEILVVDRPEINAFTFPGGLIVVNRALLETAGSPEEVAAVLAHEMGHVFYHDSANSMKTSLILAAAAAVTLDAASVRDLVQTLTRTAMTRSVEERADDFALDLLPRARIKPSRLGDFRAALPESPQNKWLQQDLPYLLDHPRQELRIQKARRAPFQGSEQPFNVDWGAVKQELANQ